MEIDSDVLKLCNIGLAVQIFRFCLGTGLLQSFVVGRPSCFHPLSHEERKTTIRYQMS